MRDTLEIVTELVESTYLDSTTSNTLKYEIKYFKCKVSKSIQYCLAYSARTYSKNKN